MKLSFPIFILSLIAISLPQIVWAQTEWQYSPLTNLPFIGDGGQDIGAYINALYLMAISVAAFLAVLRIIFGGVQYMLTDVVTTKEEAKKTIRGAIIGLLIVIAAVLVLETINPNLTDLDVINVDPNDRIPYLPTGTYDGLGDGPGTPDHVCTTTPQGCTNTVCPTDTENCTAWCDSRGGIYDETSSSCTHPSQTDVEIEEAILDSLVETAITNGEFTAVVEVVGFSMEGFYDTPVSERNEYLDNWAEACEVDGDGDETGNEFTEVGGAHVGAIRYLCVTP